MKIQRHVRTSLVSAMSFFAQIIVLNAGKIFPQFFVLFAMEQLQI